MEDKIFSCMWGNYAAGLNTYQPKHSFEAVEFFTENNGYSPKDIAAVNALEVGAEYKLNNHRIMRTE